MNSIRSPFTLGGRARAIFGSGAVLAAVFFFQGCASTGGATVSGGAVTDVKATLIAGQLRLPCETSCAGTWGASRRYSKQLYDNKLWDDLAVSVAKVGFASDLSYFYLAKAAEGLGSPAAARTYYRLAMTTHKCDGLVNNCDGIAVAAEVRERLASLDSVSQEASPSPMSQSPSTASAAGTPSPAVAPSPVLSFGKVRVIQSEFESTVILAGEGDFLPKPPFASHRNWVLVSSFEKKHPSVNVYALKVEDQYVHPRPKRWKAASTNFAQSLQVRPSDLEVIATRSDGMNIKEAFTVFLPVEVVEAGVKQETRIQVRGDGGETMVMAISRESMAAIFEAQKVAAARTW